MFVSSLSCWLYCLREGFAVLELPFGHAEHIAGPLSCGQLTSTAFAEAVCKMVRFS